MRISNWYVYLLTQTKEFGTGIAKESLSKLSHLLGVPKIWPSELVL